MTGSAASVPVELTTSDAELLERMLARRSTVVIVDMQRDYCVPGGVISALGFDVSHFSGVASRLARFLDVTAPILRHRVFVRTIAPSWTRSRALTEQYSRTALKRVVDPTLSDWFGVAPKPGDAVIEKFRYSAFEGTALDDLLRANRTETLIVAGATTDVCIDSTVRSGFMQDYGIVVLSDCTGASTPERHNHTLGVLNQFFAICTPSSEVIRRLPPG